MTNPFTKKIPPPFDHQKESSKFQVENDRVFDMSDPGTGKTRAYLDGFSERKKTTPSRKALILAPKSILQPSWGNDIEAFVPHLKYVICEAKNREKMFKEEADIYITNHDAVNWLVKNPWAYMNFTDMACDESTAFKNPQSNRSKALKKIVEDIDNRTMMTGTPMPNTVLDIFHQALVLDDGERLGTKFWPFRHSVCEPVQVGPGAAMVQWKDKPGSSEAVAAMLDDITIRNKRDECLDLPDNFITEVNFTLPTKLQKQYDAMRNDFVLQLSSENVVALNAAVKLQKLLQIASGSIYNNDSAGKLLDTSRYELVIELIKQRDQCVVAYNWEHQLTELKKLADKEGLTYGVINGASKDRTSVVNDFQSGNLKIIFAHPKSAGHGLTLTKGTTTIWVSPTYNAEQYEQFNCRIYRAGQTQKTETIHITALDTIEHDVYSKLQNKLENQQTLLEIIGV
jgi:SNF2 family DNA or RNA helicase